MNWFHFKDLPLRKKIMTITVISTSFSLLMACLFFVFYERVTYPQIRLKTLSAWVQILGDDSTAALTFNDAKTAGEMLQSLKANPDILLSCLYDSKDRIFAQYEKDPVASSPFPAAPDFDEAFYSSGSLQIFRNIYSGGESVGAIFLKQDIQEMTTRLTNYVLMAVLIGFLSFLVSLLVASRLQRYVTWPLQNIVDRMQDISRGEGDLTKRLEVSGNDEIGQVAEAFNAFVGKLQTVAEMKLDLISVVSHQLKTPVAEINGFIENMMEGLAGDLTVKQKQYLDEMRLIGRENYRLIGDLLSVSKIERGVVTVVLKAVSAKEVVNLAIRDYDHILQQKGLTLRLEGMDLDLKLHADREKVVEALRNLLNNAIKCTDKGTITIRIGTDGGLGVIEVKDTGIGMDEATLGRLFTQNRVLGKEAHRSGAGLGLYISKHFMQLQKGDITVRSIKGEGSCFTLKIPQLQEPKGAAA